MVEILAKAPLLGGRPEVDVARANDPHIETLCQRAPNATNVPLLDRHEELGLQGGRHQPDLVEKDDAAVARLEKPDARAVGARIGSSLVAEQ